MIKSLFIEYGLSWAINRLLYSAKLKMMTAIPLTERLFEKKVDVKRTDVFTLNVERIKQFLIGLSREKQIEIVSIADKAVEGIITGFSSIELNYGNPMNWHYSPITKVESNRFVKWYRIPDFDPERGDIKVVWEASRFTHFYYFARAYLITGDKKYYNAFSMQLEQWLNDNPYPLGANYKCGQECSLRMINVLMNFAVFRQCGLTTVDDKNNVSTVVEKCYKKILANFFYAHKCIKNNHTLSEICGLIVGAWCCDNEAAVRKAFKLLDKEIHKQFMPDGGYIQFSFNYQRFAFQILACILKLSERTGITLSVDSKNRIKNSVVLMYQMQDENGDLPNYGYNDGALIFPVTVCGYRDFRPTLNTLFALIESKRLYGPGDYDEELLWFESSNFTYKPSANIKKEASAFKKSGLYTLRHDDGFLMIILQNYKTRPGQMDQLHVDLWHKGKNIFCDSGTYSYANDIGKEMFLTAAHNTVKIDGKEQMKKHGAFMIYDWTKAKDVKHDIKSYTGTMISKNGYSHIRSITGMEWGYSINDEVRGSGGYCEFNFHTPYEVTKCVGGFELLDKGDVICKVAVDAGGIFIRKAFSSLYYLKKEEINRVSVICTMNNKTCNVKFDIRLIN